MWLALAAALGLHAIILFLPIAGQAPVSESIPAQIELQLITFNPQPVAEQVPDQQAEIEPPEIFTEPEEIIAKTAPEAFEPAPPPVADVKKQKFASLSEAERTRLTRSILSAQFITQESETDKLFGKPLGLPDTAPQKDFHYPVRPNMISMLDQPLPDLPFAYQPGLVRFAYDPGVKGDLQRFWDVITPEFGWKTNNGTEIRCIWVLVVMGCGWK